MENIDSIKSTNLETPVYRSLGMMGKKKSGGMMGKKKKSLFAKSSKGDDVFGRNYEEDLALSLLGELSLAHWAWNYCGGDGDGGVAFAFFDSSCPEQVGTPLGWNFQAGIAQDATRDTCNIPQGDYLFVPVVNGLYAATADDFFPGGFCEGLTNEACFDAYDALAAADIFMVAKAMLDGKDISDFVYLVEGKTTTFVADCPTDLEALGVTEPLTGIAIAKGLWVAVPPLPKGPHVLKLAGSVGDFALDFALMFNVV